LSCNFEYGALQGTWGVRNSPLPLSASKEGKENRRQRDWEKRRKGDKGTGSEEDRSKNITRQKI
jgi:hypothetical protein